jgi:hypothetical protein
MSPSARVMPTMFSPAWPRHRRLAMTGPHNPTYRNGRYSRRRRDLEHQLGALLVELRPSRILERVVRLTPAARDEVNAGLGWLTGECHPERWTLPDPRPGRPARWYIPRVAIAFAVAWLRKARAIQRLVFFHPASISSPITRLYKERGLRGTEGGRRSSADEIRRLQAFTRARGIPWTGRPETAGGPPAV